MIPHAPHQIPNSNPLWLPNIAPRKGLSIAAFVALVLLVAVVHLARCQPSLGIVWGPTPDNRGLVVRQHLAHENLPSIGTRVISIQDLVGNRSVLGNDLLLEDPDQYTNYADYNKFFKRQQLLYTLFVHGTVILLSESGQEWPVAVRKNKPISDLSLSFWLLDISALICFLIGCGVWLYRRAEITSRLLAITGISYYFSILCLSVYGSRELVVNPTLFRFLSTANHLFTLTWCCSLLLLLMFYPARLVGRMSIVAVYIVAVFAWANQTIQLVEMPLHSYYVPNHIIPYGFGIVVGCLQWRRTLNQPVERAALRWFVLSILISIGISGSSFIVPSLTSHPGSIPFWVPAASILCMFICFALGIFRYGLFHLERWWFIGWIWLAAGLLISAIDMLLVFILNINIETVVPYSILLLGWLYFPIRQWLWQYFARPETYQLEHHLPALVQSLFKSRSMQSFIDQWAELLKQVFQPLDIMVEQGVPNGVAVLQYGFELQVPNIDRKNVCRLTGNRRGSRLFGSKDIDLANSLLSLSQAIFTITNRTKEVQREGAEKERERIMRDLHDDILPKLISIKQQSESGTIKKMAEAAFQSLRETIYLLRCPTGQPLEDILADWRLETAERLNAADLKMQWQAPELTNGFCLSSHQCVNCGRILREALSNIIQHAQAKTVQVQIEIEKNWLNVAIIDDGSGNQIKNDKGLGTSNMRLRAKALDGTIAWTANKEPTTGMTVNFSFPIVECPGSTQ